MAEAVHTVERLRELQALPLERKIMITQTRIIEFYEKLKGQVYISFSGGKDSTVLLHIARQLYPSIPAVFSNTGLEYPEIRMFALSFDNVAEVFPVWGRLGNKNNKPSNMPINFKDVVYLYGYPIISKEVAQTIEEARTTPGGQRYKRLFDPKVGTKKYKQIKYNPLYFLPVKITRKCCNVMKKRPLQSYEKQENKYKVMATMTEESILRQTEWIRQGCNALNGKTIKSTPMSFWTEQDVLQYIVSNNIPIASVYGDIVSVDSDGLEYDARSGMNFGCKLKCTGCKRTGCIFCGFGLHMEKGETRFQRLAKKHPRQYEFCIGGGNGMPTRNMTQRNLKRNGTRNNCGCRTKMGSAWERSLIW